jgi:hypothetical protein
LRVRTSTTAIATSATGRSSPIASTCSPSSTSYISASTVSGSAPPDGTTTRTGNLDNNNNVTANTLSGGLPAAGILSPYTKRYAKGLSGEFLDAFAFTTFDVADVPVNVKAGQHTVYWGESLFLGGAIHGISYSQNSVDVWKGFATPGSEAKELFRPRGGLRCRRSRRTI